MLAWMLRGLALLASVGLVLAGLIALGRYGLDQVRDRDRYILAFADIDCAPPPGLGRAEFLDEVQYLAGSPDRLRLLDEDLPARLAACFGRHPWGAKVERVDV